MSMAPTRESRARSAGFKAGHDAAREVAKATIATLTAERDELQQEIAGIAANLRELEAARQVVAAAALEHSWNPTPPLDPLFEKAWTETNDLIAEYLRVMEAQGFRPCSKCGGRGFIRTLVDGERDSEPCSYCRMSGRVMEEQR